MPVARSFPLGISEKPLFEMVPEGHFPGGAEPGKYYLV